MKHCKVQTEKMRKDQTISMSLKHKNTIKLNHWISLLHADG